MAKKSDQFTINKLTRFEKLQLMQQQVSAVEPPKDPETRKAAEEYIQKVAEENGGKVSFDGPRTMWDAPKYLINQMIEELKAYGNLLESTQKQLKRYGIEWYNDPGLKEVNDIYVVTPLEDARLKAIYTILNTIPVGIDAYVKELGERLADKGVKKFQLAQDYNKLNNWASRGSKEIMEKLIAMEEDGFYPMNFHLKAADKLISKMQEFLIKNPNPTREEFRKFFENYLVWYTQITKVSNTNEYEKELLDEVTLLYKLNEGDEFIFVRKFGATSMDYKEFVYMGIDSSNRAWYKDIYDSNFCDPFTAVLKIWPAS